MALNKIKDGIANSNKKVILGGATVLMTAAIIGVSSFFPFVIDPSGWQNVDFLTKEIIIAVIVVAGTISSMFIGQAKNGEDPRSNLAKANRQFISTYESVKPRASGFRQWVRKVMEPADKKDRMERLFAKYGIKQPSVVELERSEIKSLINGPKEINGKKYMSITKRQYRFIMNVLDGRYEIRYVSPDYYMTTTSIASSKNRSEKAGKETMTKTVMLGTNLVSRIVRSMLFGATFASLIYDSASAGSEAEQAMAWLTFISRMGSLCMSCFSGYILGSKNNDVDAEFVKLKESVLADFLADTKFVEKTDDEIAEEEYEKAMAKIGTESKEVTNGRGKTEEDVGG